MQIIERLDQIDANYDTLLVDLWGCLHNGVAPFPSAVAALQSFRARGGAVCLLTNAPRSRQEVKKHLNVMGLPEDCWDTIATSGDSARVAMYSGAVGQKIWFIGEPGDEPFFERMALMENAPEITRVPLKDAEGIICTGPFDRTADPNEMRPQFLMAKQMGLKLLCANPDIVVDRGERREWCAGALAALYSEMGGESLSFGKPYPPVYDLARRRLAEIGKPADPSRTLAIGDGIATDIQGALGEDIDSLFITSGLAASETGTAEQPDPEKLDAFLTGQLVTPTFSIGRLR